MLTIFSGRISVKALAAQIIIVNVTGLVGQVPYGISLAASALTGVLLGRGEIEQAKFYSRLILIFNIFVTIGILLVLNIGQDSIANFFTQDEETDAIVRRASYSFALYIFFDSINAAQQGVIRGLGLQMWGAVFSLVSNIVIGLPLSLWLSFEMGWGV